MIIQFNVINAQTEHLSPQLLPKTRKTDRVIIYYTTIQTYLKRVKQMVMNNGKNKCVGLHTHCM